MGRAYHHVSLFGQYEAVIDSREKYERSSSAIKISQRVPGEKPLRDVYIEHIQGIFGAEYHHLSSKDSLSSGER